MRLIILLSLTVLIGCSGSTSSDNNKPDPNNDSNASNNGSNNSTTQTNNGTGGTNNTTGANNTTGTNNLPGTNNTTGTNNRPDPRDPFSGLCNPPETMRMDDGCTVFWRCSSQLTLECKDDGTGTAVCACTKGGNAANSFSTTTEGVCGADEATLTQLAADECSWEIDYMNALMCEPGEEVAGRAACSWTWACDGAKHKIDCTDDRNGGYDCACVIDDRPNGVAFPADVCGNDEANAIRAARAGCGWDIMIN